MIELRWLGLGAAAFLVGCSPPPAPVINVTVVVQPPPAESKPAEPAPPPGLEAAAATGAPWRNPNTPGDWPEWGWRVLVCYPDQPASCWPRGPALEFIDQCYDLAKTVKEGLPANEVTECHWLPIVPRERDPNYRVI